MTKSSFKMGIFASWKSSIYYFLAAVLIGLNIFTLLHKIGEYKLHRTYPNMSFPGFKFNGLQSFTGSAQFIGYYTDKNLSDVSPGAQFAQAQYVLAPAVLDTSNLQHPYVILDCSTEQIALAKISSLGLKPLRKNNFGIILANRP